MLIQTLDNLNLMLTPTLNKSNLPPTWSNFCLPLANFCIIEEKKQCTEARNIESISKHPCQCLSLLFCHCSSNSVSILVCFVKFFCCILIKVCCLINLYLLLPLKWSVYDSCIPSPSIYFAYFLIPVICFELLIIQTFFDIPRRFELWGVDCTYFTLQNPW